jgi:phage repressor protein C with HTH and peptisase S24 domain
LVDNKNTEQISVVPIKAAAGYLNGHADSEYLEELPYFCLPLNEISTNKSYRVFQIRGDSMLPVNSGSYIIAEYLENWKNLKDDKCYILITKDEGIVYKRIKNKIFESNEIILNSDNPDYTAYSVDINSVFEIWRAIGFITFSLPNQDDLTFDKLSSLVIQLREDVNKIKKKDD